MQRLIGVLAIPMLLICGCSAEPPVNLPKLFGVVGHVNRAGGEAITGGALQFQSIDQPDYVALAEIQPDGSFTLHTIVDGQKFTGAVVGPQRVTYLPRTSQSESAEEPHTFKEPFVVKAEDNQFTIAIPAKR
jgi:hypothetical protein